MLEEMAPTGMRSVTVSAQLLLIAAASLSNADESHTDSANGYAHTNPTVVEERRFENVSDTHMPQPPLLVQSKDAKPADVDGDGDLDLLIAHEYRANVLLINDGTGRFANESSSRLPQLDRDSEDIVTADFDGDGDLDVLFVSEDDEENEFYLNNGDGTFSDERRIIATRGITNGVASADVNNDGRTDIVFGNGRQNRLLINDGAGGFRDETDLRMPIISDVTQDLEFGDVDEDGDLDLLVANEDHNRLLINDGTGVFSDESKNRLNYRDQPEETREGDFGDVDGDGDLDIVFANVNFRRVGDPQDRLLINDGNGRYSDETTTRLPASDDYTMDADFVDIDSDGDLDLVTAGLIVDKGLVAIPYRVYENDGTGVYTDATSKYFDEDIVGVGTDIEAADFNGDNRLDLFLTNRAGPDILLFGQSTNN